MLIFKSRGSGCVIFLIFYYHTTCSNCIRRNKEPSCIFIYDGYKPPRYLNVTLPRTDRPLSYLELIFLLVLISFLNPRKGKRRYGHYFSDLLRSDLPAGSIVADQTRGLGSSSLFVAGEVITQVQSSPTRLR
ncbi:hypothetical protein NE237_009530 [Protea cynaroides]|uniref:Uncharacterized protein n=1 Tax=Protea cynaroides TaxID=273540 RepID=A0A9Q0R0U5_9MAGN|nr:hypothetical protein NE237_009530 [Protea cynaroides]